LPNAAHVKRASAGLRKHPEAGPMGLNILNNPNDSTTQMTFMQSAIWENGQDPVFAAAEKRLGATKPHYIRCANHGSHDCQTNGDAPAFCKLYSKCTLQILK